MNISNLSFHDLTNNVVRVAKTDINIYENPGKDISHLINAAPERSVPVFNDAGSQPAPDGSFKPMTELNSNWRDDSVNRLTREREEFYAESKPLQNEPSKTPVGFNIIDDNYVMILTSTSNSGNNLFRAGHDLTIMEPPNSVLGFKTRIDNLRNLYEYLGDTAAEHKETFDFAIQDIANSFLHRGGMYVNADKEGVTDSIRAIFNGEEGKYTADDLKTMAVLSFERVGIGAGDGGSEFQTGATFGLNALQIEMAREAGKLSDAAYETVKAAFDESVDDYIKQMDRYQELAKTDPFGPKGVTYSPIRPELVYKSIDIMLGAMKNDDFNQGLREAFKTLEDMHTAQRDNQLMEKGEADARFSTMFAGTVRERTFVGDYMQISSRSFTDYLNRPEWSINGNPFSISVSA